MLGIIFLQHLFSSSVILRSWTMSYSIIDKATHPLGGRLVAWFWPVHAHCCTSCRLVILNGA